MALCFRKAQAHKAGSNFPFAVGRHLISYFCFTIILANINITFNYLSLINITVEGTGRQQIFYSYFYLLPSKILVNGVPQNINNRYEVNLVNQTNIITLRWNYEVSTCSKMFQGLNNITNIDLSFFNISKVVSFYEMFDGCTSLKSINLM